jgi:hypothetical protein
MKIVIIAGALAMLSASSPSLSASTAEAQVRALEDATAAALVRRDKAAYLANIAPDYLAQVDDGLHDRADLVSNWWPNVRFTSIKNDFKAIRITGSIAVVIGQDVERSSWKGRDTSGRYSWTDIWQKRGGKWQLSSAQITKMS